VKMLIDFPDPLLEEFTLHITVMIEGFTSGTAMVADTITVELRNTSAPYDLVKSKKIFLNISGQGSSLFTEVTNEVPYYIVVKHRNSIETWSAAGQVFTAGTLSYDFTTAASQAYGNNMVIKGSKWCIYSGDVNQDRSVDSQDMTAVDNDANNFISGYVSTDINGDESVDSQDMTTIDNNAFYFVGSIIPPADISAPVQGAGNNTTE
jgi:hypothetical protein